jgi:kinesin family protein 18/19
VAENVVRGMAWCASQISGVMNGIHGTIFAYGQTASGKTFTMMGTRSQPGLTVLSMAQIFDHISQVV